MSGFIPSTGTISFTNDIENVFEDQSPPTMKLSEYYRNGTNIQTAVTASNVDQSSVVTSGIPVSGTISFSDFRNQGFSISTAQSVIFDRNNTTTGQDFTWTVPSGVTEVSAFLVGAGGGGGGSSGSGGEGGAGGGGGGTVWGYWSVTAGTTYTLRIGNGGDGGNGNTGLDGGDGGDTYIKSGSTIIMQAYGGDGGETDAGSTQFVGFSSGGNGRGGIVGSGVTGQAQTGGDGGDGGGNKGGGGGGGAAGYGGVSSGNGGDGEHADGTGRQSGVGGSAAGGERSLNTFPPAISSGGAVGLFGQVKSGTKTSASATAGVSNSIHGSTYDASTSSSIVPSSGPGSITPPTGSSANNLLYTGSAASPGGGGAGVDDDVLGFGHKGGDGAIRIVWGTASNGNARRYPSYTNVSET